MAPHWLRQIWSYRVTMVIVLTPLLLLPLPLVLKGTEASCGYIILLMAIFWITEAIPLAVTAFLPLILFPLTGIMDAKEVSKAYFTDTAWLFIGGLMIAVAIEDSGLHKRIALRVLLLFGTKPRCLMFGFMATTFFLSMWISNTATTAMMLPIVEAVFTELKADNNRQTEEQRKAKPKTHEGTSFHNKDVAKQKSINCYDNPSLQVDEDDINKVDTIDHDFVNVEIEEAKVERIDENDNKRMEKMIKGITLCIPYASSIGGTATLTGTAPNLVLSGQFEVLFPDAPQLLSFGSWLAYCFPGALLTLLLAYLWLTCFFLGFSLSDIKSCVSCKEKSQGEKNAEKILHNEYSKLGKMRWVEGSVLVVFVITALLWFFRKPGFMPGWQEIFIDGYVSDGTVAMTMAFILFVLPRERPKFMCNNQDNKIIKPTKPIADWPTMQMKFPWSVTLLLTGGFALASGATKSGFSQWMGDQLAFLRGIEPWAICLVVTIIVCLFTECSSNTATASLFVPILAQLAQVVEVHPLFLMIAPVLASSLAFMLPVATPPNAIAFSYGHLKVVDLVKAGWMLNLIGVLVITLFINTYGTYYFGLDVFPAWAALPASNLTSMQSTTQSPFNSSGVINDTHRL